MREHRCPNVLHHPVALAALRAGKHVLCEKPLGTGCAAGARAGDGRLRERPRARRRLQPPTPSRCAVGQVVPAVRGHRPDLSRPRLVEAARRHSGPRLMVHLADPRRRRRAHRPRSARAGLASCTSGRARASSRSALSRTASWVGPGAARWIARSRWRARVRSRWRTSRALCCGSTTGRASRSRSAGPVTPSTTKTSRSNCSGSRAGIRLFVPRHPERTRLTVFRDRRCCARDHRDRRRRGRRRASARHPRVRRHRPVGRMWDAHHGEYALHRTEVLDACYRSAREGGEVRL